VSRTLVDLAGQLNEVRLHRVLEQAQITRCLNLNALTRQLDRSKGKRGVALLRRLVSELEDEPPRLNRELERRFREFLRERRLPAPVINGHVLGYEVDFHWPQARLIVETDGRETHATVAAFERDRRRDLDLKLAGWTVIRITWRMLHEQPERVEAILRMHLTSDKGRGVSPGL